MNSTSERALQLARDESPVAVTRLRLGDQHGDEVIEVPIPSLRPGRSPRLRGIDRAHVARLAGAEAQYPPILVHRRTMQVIDGMHRLLAAAQRGCETIEVVFFEGSEVDAFLRAVSENVTHGLPLSQADRRAAAERIASSHPYMSDRAIGRSAGLAAPTVAGIRRRALRDEPAPGTRVGLDGRVRPLDSGGGRQRAAELLAQKPEASLRDVARAAGISPATAQDVRRRLERGESPVPAGCGRTGTGSQPDRGKGPAAPRVAGGGGAGGGTPAEPRPARRPGMRGPRPLDAVAVARQLMRDPSLRNSDQGKEVLRLVHSSAVGTEELPLAVTAVPPHCAAILIQLAHQYAQMWQDFARELEKTSPGQAPPADRSAQRPS